MAKGYSARGKNFKVHLDGYHFMPYFQGKEKAGPRDSIMYFDPGGNLKLSGGTTGKRASRWRTATSRPACARFSPGP
jgi:hypothetical protein